MTHTNSRAGYDRLAAHYQTLETLTFGARLQQTRTALLPRLRHVKRVLILGDGDGRFLHALLTSNPHCQIDCLEQSSNMIEQTRKRLSPTDLNRVHFIHTDALTYHPTPNHYDCIVTAFFLDCFTHPQLEFLVDKFMVGLKPDGCWYYADFFVPLSGFWRVRARVWLRVMYWFFRWQTGISASHLVNPDGLFVRAGLTCVAERFLSQRLLVARLYRRA